MGGLTTEACLGQGEAVRVPGEQAVAGGPLGDRLAQDGLVPKVLDVKLAVRLQPLHYGLPRDTS